MQPLPPGLGDRPFSVGEARARGVHVERLRRSDLRSDFPGVRTPSRLPDDFSTRCRASARRLGSGQFFSHITAARIWGMRLPAWHPREPIHVTTVQPQRTPRVRGISGHHVASPGPDLELCDGLIVPSAAETWRMLSGVLTLDQLVVAGDGLLARRDPTATLPMLRRMVALNAGRRGNLRLRAALDLLRPRTDSARETTTRLLLTRAGLPEPEVNGSLSDPGRPMRFGDLVYRTWRVVVEYEGIHHQQSRQAYLEDIRRYAELSDRWTFVRVTKEHAPSEIVDLVSTALRRAGWRP